MADKSLEHLRRDKHMHAMDEFENMDLNEDLYSQVTNKINNIKSIREEMALKKERISLLKKY